VAFQLRNIQHFMRSRSIYCTRPYATYLCAPVMTPGSKFICLQAYLRVCLSIADPINAHRLPKKARGCVVTCVCSMSGFHHGPYKCRGMATVEPPPPPAVVSVSGSTRNTAQPKHWYVVVTLSNNRAMSMPAAFADTMPTPGEQWHKKRAQDNVNQHNGDFRLAVTGRWAWRRKPSTCL